VPSIRYALLLALAGEPAGGLVVCEIAGHSEFLVLPAPGDALPENGQIVLQRTFDRGEFASLLSHEAPRLESKGEWVDLRIESVTKA
jgi:hypothetical protein